jgi:hypothetical protein
MHTRGALLFDFSSPPTAGGGRPSEAHVAISLGDGRTIEAMDTKHGVLTSTAAGRFNYAAVIPQFAGGAPAGSTGSALGGMALAGGPSVDTDHDGLTDAIEMQLGTDPTKADTDGDGISDGYEVTKLHTSATAADSDHDGISDSIELAHGTDPTNPDTAHIGRLDGTDGSPDSDHDGLSDALEKILGTNPNSVDSDGDGITDGAEYQAHYNPLDPSSNPLAALSGGVGGLGGSGLGGSALGGSALGTGLGGSALGGNPLGSGLGTGALPGGIGAAGGPDPANWGLDDLPGT